MYAINVSEKGKKMKAYGQICLGEDGTVHVYRSDWDYPLTNKAISTDTFKAFAETLRDSLRYVIKDIN